MLCEAGLEWVQVPPCAPKMEKVEIFKCFICKHILRTDNVKLHHILGLPFCDNCLRQVGINKFKTIMEECVGKQWITIEELRHKLLDKKLEDFI